MIYIASTYTADVLSTKLTVLLQKFCDEQVCFHYNQIYQQALLPDSDFNKNRNGLNVLLIRAADLFSRKKENTSILSDLIAALNSLQKTTNVPLLIIFTPTQTKTTEEDQYYATLEHTLKLAIEPNTNTSIVSSNETKKVSNPLYLFDNLTEQYGHIPYTMDFYNSLAVLIARQYALRIRKPYKVIVLDCDGTLWRGIVEEDGIDGLVINNEYLALQHFMIDLFKAGFLLCLCSKNSENSVLNVFHEHKDMALDINTHICSYRINWLPKSVNIQSLAEELSLGLDSFIFIDDNHIECAEVKSALPEVLVIHLPDIQSKGGRKINTLKNRLDYLKNIWAFDLKSSSSVDEKRTEFYKNNRLRHALQSQSTSNQAFLKNLNIKTMIQDADPKDCDRIIQLNQRTNQFNLFPNALSDTEVSKRITQKQQSSGCFSIEVSDKYGDYGLVGVCIYDLTQDSLVVKNFLLSCRILGREIEYTVIHYLVRIAEQHNINIITFLFKITEKNIPAIGFLQHVAVKNVLEDVNKVSFSLAHLKKIKPKTIYTSESNRATKPTDHKQKTSPDYILDIAQYCTQVQAANIDRLNKKELTIRYDKLPTIENSLLELLKQHKLIAYKKEEIPFIDIGIDSLTCVLLASAIYQRFRVEVPPFELLKSDFTLKKLAQYLLKQIKISHEAPPETRLISSQDIPLSLTQKQLWSDEQITPGTSRNHMFCAFEIETDIDLEIMQRTFAQLIAQNDSLRFSFKQNKAQTSVQLNALESIHFKVCTFACDNDEEIKRYVIRFRQTPFNLLKPPLFRAAIIRREHKTTLLFCIHHIIHDGWSLNLLIREFSTIYHTYSKQVSLPDRGNALAYIRFIQWQQRHISPKLLEKQRTFWEKQAQHMPKLNLIYDKAKKEEYEVPLNHRIEFKINASITRKLKSIALTNQVTLYHVLSSAFGLFLSHYADQNDINFITAVSGRHHPNSANVMGLFTRLLLIRMDIDNQESFSQLIAKNKKNMDDLFNNQDLPFNEIIQLTGERVNSRMHAFNQAGFIFQSYPISNLIINEKSAKRVFADDKAQLLYDACDVCRFGNLVCFMQEHQSELHGLLEYNTSLFNKKRIQSMIRAFKTLIKNISEHPEQTARAIPLITDTQYQAMHSKWNQPKQSYPNHLNLLACFSEQVTARAHSLAIVHNSSHISYGELDKISNQLARALQKEGVHHEVAVGIFLENNLTRIIAMLGILKAGGCYVPLETDSPVYRTNNIIKDSKLLFMITDNTAHLQTISEDHPEIKSILITKNSLQSESNAPILNTTSPKQLAYIMYTSGSTGNPKGIEIEQRGILRLVKSSNYININPKDCIAQTSSFLFDASTFEIWGALLNGATLNLIDKQTVLDHQSLSQAIKDKQISILFLTTQLFHAYAHLAPHLFQKLRYVVVGGEAVSHEAIERILNQKNKPSCFINGYGPTENTTFSTSYSIKNKKQLSNPIPIGKPITGTQVYVLDHALNPRPIGAPGTLYLGGAGLARRYINQEQLNQEQFIHHLGERLYNTGDIVSWKPDGNLQYIGRKDNQVKINGHRIELDEIKLQLETHPLIIQAIVLLDNNRQLVAYILLKRGHELQALNVHRYLKNILPQYMLPQFYYQMDEVPLSAQGKIDNNALLKQAMLPINYTEYAPAKNKIQEQLLSIYAALLNTASKEISINADFFELGGSSISALHLIDKINHQFKVTLSFSDIYQCAHIKSLSEQISALLSNKHCTHTPYNKNALKLVKEGALEKTPIVFIHPIGGTGFCYLDLIKILPHDQPCYLIQDPSIDADKILFQDIPSMATYYNNLLLNELKATQFILAGYSFGGMLSLEMASQLESKKLNEAIRLVIAFDTWVISSFMNAKAKEALRLSIMKQYERVEHDLLKGNINPKPWMELQYHRLQNLGFAYKPPIINKKIMLFKASQQPDEFSAMNDETNYLTAHTNQGVDVYLVPGNHNSILQYPHVTDIARLLGKHLKDNVF